MVIRLLDPERVQPVLDGLGITRVAQWREGVNRAYGLSIVAGPVGSGKTTTLNATLREINRFERSVCTAEDPVEYRIPYTTQVSINRSVGLDFERVLPGFLRMDANVMVIGEIRTRETAEAAIKAAETGHMVIGTLHTGSVTGAVDRLRHLGIPNNELHQLLRSVLAQRLVRTLCPQCGGSGCRRCMGTGYGGRTVVSECAYFENELAAQELTRGNRNWPTMVDDAFGKLERGITNADELVRVFGSEAHARLNG